MIWYEKIGLISVKSRVFSNIIKQLFKLIFIIYVLIFEKISVMIYKIYFIK